MDERQRGIVAPRRAFAGIVFGVLMLGAASAWAQGTLSAEQEAAREMFMGNVSDALAKAKESCGEGFELVTDFEHYDEAAWTAQYKRHARAMTAFLCAGALEDVARVCSPSPPQSRKGKAPKAPPPPPIAVTRVTCLFTGASDIRQGEDPEVHVRRNASFKDGALTVRIAPAMAYNGNSAFEGVIRGVAAFATVAKGGSCKTHPECATGLCASNRCTACSARRKCPGKFDVCTSGVCQMAAPKSNVKAGRDQPCGKTSDCEGGLTCQLTPPGSRWIKACQ